MPQLPPVAAAVFVICLLGVIVTTTVVVQVRSRRRRANLARMVRATAPVPRPTGVVAVPAATAAPLRGRSYDVAAEQGRFIAFAERPGREPAPGRPARRLAAQIAHAADSAVAALPSSPPPPIARPDHSTRGQLGHAPASHAGLAEVILDLGPFAVPVMSAVVDRGVPVSNPIAVGAVGELAGPASVFEAGRNPEVAETVPAPAVREPRITVLPPGPAVSTLPALMTREVTLGDAARALRGTLPGVLTMTDGRHLRRAVAVGAATSVLVAAFAIRGRHAR